MKLDLVVYSSVAVLFYVRVKFDPSR